MSAEQAAELMNASMDRRYREQVTHTAQRLREMADDVERMGVEYGGDGPVRRTRVDAAHRIMHAVVYGLANAHLDGLVQAAGDADWHQQVAHQDADSRALRRVRALLDDPQADPRMTTLLRSALEPPEARHG